VINGKAMGRVTSLMSSVMDLHVRIALQEVDKEKRRLIGGGVFLGAGLTLLMLALVAGEVLALLLWLRGLFGWGWLTASLVVAVIDLVLAGLFLRLGGQLLKGPYLPQTTAGLSRTTRALLGRG
jgi:uncharacterized membrane protein YqjE